MIGKKVKCFGRYFNTSRVRSYLRKFNVILSTNLPEDLHLNRLGKQGKPIMLIPQFTYTNKNPMLREMASNPPGINRPHPCNLLCRKLEL